MKAAFISKNFNALDRVYAQRQREAIAQRFELLPGYYSDPADPALKDVEVLFSTWGMPAASEETIRECLPNLKYLFYGAGSVQAFARPFLNCGVRLFSAWQANAVPVAQYTFAQIVLALKGFFPSHAAARTSRANAHEVFSHYPGVFDVKVGLLGCGAIGSLVAKMLRQLDVEVLAYDPFLSPERAKELGVRVTGMDEVFAECDVVSNHLANLPETVGIIRRECFLSMKPYSTFINTGRGAQLNEDDLYDALTQDPTRWALLDVLNNEQFSDANRLNTLPNCLITPHIAGSSGLEVRRMADYMIEACDLVRQDKPCSYEVFLPMLATMA